MTKKRNERNPNKGECGYIIQINESFDLAFDSRKRGTPKPKDSKRGWEVITEKNYRYKNDVLLKMYIWSIMVKGNAKECKRHLRRVGVDVKTIPAPDWSMDRMDR